MSYDELIMDCEFIRMIRKVVGGLSVNADTLAVDVIKAVGPVGNYLSQKHTVKHVREMSKATLIDRRPREPWENDGATTLTERAHAKALSHFADYKAPELDPEIAAKIRTIVERAEAETDTEI